MSFDTLNKFAVSSTGDQVVVLMPVHGRALSPQDALILAAWLVALAEPSLPDGAPRFAEVLEAVRSI